MQTVYVEVTGLDEVKKLFDGLECHLDAARDVIEQMENIQLGVRGRPARRGQVCDGSEQGAFREK